MPTPISSPTTGKNWLTFTSRFSGVLHCGDGRGCDTVDWITLITGWVEKSKAPHQVLAKKVVDGKMMSKHIGAYKK